MHRSYSANLRFNPPSSSINVTYSIDRRAHGESADSLGCNLVRFSTVCCNDYAQKPVAPAIMVIPTVHPSYVGRGLGM